MKQIIRYLVLAVLTLGTGTGYAQVLIINEGFSTANVTTTPVDWLNSAVSGQPGDLWHFDNPGSRSINFPVTAPFAIFDAVQVSSDGNPEVVLLETPYFDASIGSYTLLSFDHIFKEAPGAMGRIMAYNGTAWFDVITFSSGTSNPQHEVIDITAVCAGKTNAKLRFQWEGNGAGYWAIDNVRISAPPALVRGWNILSFNQIPGYKDLKAIVQSLIDDGSLIKLQDENGKSIEDFGIFGGWINNIGEMAPTEGYKIKVTRDCKINMDGSPVILPYKIPLKAGWNIVGYPRPQEGNALSIVQQLIDRGTLNKVQDETGNAIEDLGSFGGWVNNIGSFKPGEGYKIKINANDTLILYDKSDTYSVSIYGRDICGYTTALRQSCTSSGIRFQYFNIDSNPDYWSAMWDIIYQFSLGTGGYVLLPVVKVEKDYKTYGLERPGVEDIKKLIGY